MIYLSPAIIFGFLFEHNCVSVSCCVTYLSWLYLIPVQEWFLGSLVKFKIIKTNMKHLVFIHTLTQHWNIIVQIGIQDIGKVFVCTVHEHSNPGHPVDQRCPKANVFQPAPYMQGRMLLIFRGYATTISASIIIYTIQI